MPAILVVIVVGLLLLWIAYLNLQLYINRRILNAFQHAPLLMPAASDQTAGVKTGLMLFGLIVFAGFMATLLAR